MVDLMFEILLGAKVSRLESRILMFEVLFRTMASFIVDEIAEVIVAERC